MGDKINLIPPGDYPLQRWRAFKEGPPYKKNERVTRVWRTDADIEIWKYEEKGIGGRVKRFFSRSKIAWPIAAPSSKRYPDFSGINVRRGDRIVVAKAGYALHYPDGKVEIREGRIFQNTKF